MPPDGLPDEGPRPSYREVAPPDHLREQVVCFWHRARGSQATETRVLPDGCVDLIWVADEPPFIAGPMTVPIAATTPAGTEIVAVRFQPGAAASVLGVSARDLRNQQVPLADIWPSAGARPWADVVAGQRLPAALEAMTTLIASRLEAAGRQDRWVMRGARWIAAHPAGDVGELTRLSGLSERQLRRRFDEAVGYGPKMLQRILRVQRLLWLASLSRGETGRLCDLALAAGYADQAHMTREVGALAGASPARLLLGARPRSAVSDLFKTLE